MSYKKYALVPFDVYQTLNKNINSICVGSKRQKLTSCEEVSDKQVGGHQSERVSGEYMGQVLAPRLTESASTDRLISAETTPPMSSAESQGAVNTAYTGEEYVNKPVYDTPNVNPFTHKEKTKTLSVKGRKKLGKHTRSVNTTKQAKKSMHGPVSSKKWFRLV